MIDIDRGDSPDAHVASPPFDTKKPQPSWLGLSRFRPNVCCASTPPPVPSASAKPAWARFGTGAVSNRAHATGFAGGEPVLGVGCGLASG